MELKNIILFGPSGSGKGTQAKLLIEKLEKKDTQKKVIYIETGKKFREFIKEENHTANIVEEILDEGGLLPAFLPIWIWTRELVDRYTGKEHLILDGLSRRPHEAPILDSAMRFYGIKSPDVIIINISKEVATQRLLDRGRYDDEIEDIKARYDWYEESVVPAIDFFRMHKDFYNIHELDGEKDIKDVEQDIDNIVFG